MPLGSPKTGGEKDTGRYNKVHQVYSIDHNFVISFSRESWDPKKEVTTQGNQDQVCITQQLKLRVYNSAQANHLAIIISYIVLYQVYYNCFMYAYCFNSYNNIMSIIVAISKMEKLWAGKSSTFSNLWWMLELELLLTESKFRVVPKITVVNCLR